MNYHSIIQGDALFHDELTSDKITLDGRGTMEMQTYTLCARHTY